MPTYTTSAEVLKHLPASPPAAVTDYTSKDITDASAIVESRVGGRFALSYESSTQKFPNIGSSPATPPIIELAAQYLAASLQHVRLAMNARTEVSSQAEILQDRADSILENIRNGETEVILNGAEIGSRIKLARVEDTFYENDTDPKEKFDRDALDLHWK